MAGFQTLLGLGLPRAPITYREIIDQAAYGDGRLSRDSTNTADIVR
jgi:hypothetical protein